MARRIATGGALALALLLTAGAARADDFGLAVYDADDALLTTRWAPESILVGSAADCDLVLEGLSPLHARFSWIDGRLSVLPLTGEVVVDGASSSELRRLDTEQDVRIGPYRVQFFLPKSAQLGLPEATEPEGTEVGVGQAGRSAADARATEFEKKAYRFCHDPGYGDDGVVGADFCVIFDEGSKEVCPGVERCKEWKKADPNWQFGRVEDGSSSGRARRIARRKPLIELPELPPFVGYLVIGALILALVIVFVRALVTAGWEDEELDLTEAEISDAARKLQALPEARSQVLLRMAARALEEKGDAHEAAILVHLAILRHLDDEGLVRYHPSKTNGDYLRAIRRKKDLADLFKAVVYQTERIRFGDGQVDVDVVAQALVDAEQVLPRHRGAARPGPGLAGGPLALLVLGLGASACGPAPGAQAYYNHGPAGMSALVPLLRSTGLRVEVKRDRLIDLPVETGLIVLRTSAVGAGPWPKEFKLDTQLDFGRTVIVIDDLGQSAQLLPSTASVAVSGDAPEATELALDIHRDLVSCAAPLYGLKAGIEAEPVRLPKGRLILWDGVSQTSTISSHPLVMRPFLRDAARREARGHTAAYGWAVHRSTGDEDLPGCLFVFADRDLFTNASLTRAENAAFVAQMFAALVPEDGIVVFADRIDQWTTSESDNPFGGGGGDDPNPAQALEASNLLPFILQAIASLALLYIALGAAFGPLRDPKESHHKAFVEHVEAIGRQYARLGKPGLTHSASSLARFVVLRYRDRVRGGEGGGWAALAKELADKHDLDEAHVKAALRLGIEGKSELGAPQPGDPLPSSQEMLQTLSRLLSAQHRQLSRAAAAAAKGRKDA